MSRTKSGAVLICGLAVAWTAGPGCDDGGGSSTTPQEFCNSSGPAFCDYFFRCFSQDDLESLGGALEFTNRASCGTALIGGCEESTVAGVAAGRQSFSPSAADACIGDLADATCMSLDALIREDGFPPSSCQSAATGLVEWKGFCARDSDCAGGPAHCHNGRCTDALHGESFEKDCSEPTAGDCAGLVCLTLNDNLQNKTGICTAACDGTSDCGSGATCWRFDDNAAVCLSDCSASADCSNGFECIEVGEDGSRGCLVETP